ncbi:sensor histidine kinase [Natrinema altunense]|uniref:HAMP domain-containing histidine kinase n=1 Tax=Natrinema altunense TaxID=222984 RepID=A0A482Y6C5_9EURY|nr:GAF domain-containing protein [Natrinema altunense]RZH69685.1 HAMP domain-containing histidine kinase [Natrinema altunense]
MTTGTATQRPRTVLYVADAEAAASDGASALEAVDAGPERSVHAVTAVDRVRNWAPDADCVVFAETPTTAAGASLLEVIEACGSTPVILFTDPSFAPTAARSTDGIDGYVRRNTDDAVAHLADEIEWVCRDTGDAGSADRAASAPGPAERFLESVPEVVACRDRDRLFERLVETAADALDRETCWLSTVHFGEFTPRATASGVSDDDLEPVSRDGVLDETLQTGETLRIDEIANDDRLTAPLDGVTSLCCVPVGDIGLLQVAADEAAAFDDRDCDSLAAWCRVAAAVLERIDADASQRTAHKQLQQERDRLAGERDELAAERDRLADERDRVRALFETIPEPAVRYEIDDGRVLVRDSNDAFDEVFRTDPEGAGGEDPAAPGLEHRRATLLESLRAGERRQLVSRRETVDGVREFLLTLVPVDGGASDGEAPDAHTPDGLLVYSDVTEASRRERAVAAAEARLETIETLVDEEMRTPLNVARGYLELAEETGAAEHFAEVDDAQKRLRELVDRLVSIVRRDDVLVETEPVAIHDVARRAWVTVETGDARLVTHTADDRVLEADKARLRDLFEQLLRTVIDAADGTDCGTKSGDETVGPADADTETTVVTVGATDDGFYVARRDAESDAADADDGIETDPVPDQLTAADGTGIGLDTVERIADAHGWNVGVAADDGRIAVAFRGVDAGDAH